jgi:hypothetical protein
MIGGQSLYVLRVGYGVVSWRSKKMSIKLYAMLLMKRYGLGGFLNMLEKRKSNVSY